MSTWLLPRSRLTPEQLRVVEFSPSEHRLVVGPPGSGKTQILIWRAEFLRRAMKSSNGHFMIFVYTRVLKDYIRSSLEMVDLPDSSVTNFDQWCSEVYRTHIHKSLPWDADNKTPDFSAIRSGVHSHVSRNKEIAGSLDFVLVDEGQDLTPQTFDILRLLAKHVTVFADHQQQIFEGGATESSILRSLGFARRNVTLLADYRNSTDVAQLASYFITDLEKRCHFLAQIKNTSATRERPLYFIASSFDRELDRLADVIRQRLLMNQRILIIVPQNRQVFGIAKGLAERGIDVEKAVAQKQKKGEPHTGPVRFDNNLPKIATYHSAKGLTFDCVLMPRLSDNSFDHARKRGQSIEQLIFVGITRAIQWVYLSSVKQTDFVETRLLEDAAAKGHLIMQRDSEISAAEGSHGHDDSSAEDYSIL